MTYAEFKEQFMQIHAEATGTKFAHHHFFWNEVRQLWKNGLTPQVAVMAYMGIP